MIDGDENIACSTLFTVAFIVQKTTLEEPFRVAVNHRKCSQVFQELLGRIRQYYTQITISTSLLTFRTFTQ